MLLTPCRLEKRRCRNNVIFLLSVVDAQISCFSPVRTVVWSKQLSCAGRSSDPWHGALNNILFISGYLIGSHTVDYHMTSNMVYLLLLLLTSLFIYWCLIEERVEKSF